ncbi:glutathione S-transferase N-terminal domain-containing protein [Oceanicoccus sagamiensis]|nr:glutathione S-transferase N-terminal domain-containing protein [Oceanicoccus sagamiensis]
MTYKLYGLPSSLYTGKVRSYLRKQGIPFIEHGVNHPHYQKTIIPSVGRFIMPVVEAADGTLIQDGADIIDYLEEHETVPLPAQPESTLLKTVSYLFELFGGEGLLRPAMHYRWSFDEQLDFIKDDFLCALVPPGTDQQTRDGNFDFASQRMRAASKSFGVTEDSKPLIESSYLEFLQLFAQHLHNYPYLLGGRPTMGDYGLVSALYAHLARDPVPAKLMREKAPAVSRWVERMNAAETIDIEYADYHTDLIAAGQIPDTLKALMIYIAQEYLAELEAHVAFANNWLRNHPELKTGTNGLDDPAARFIGKAEFDWRGLSLRTGVLPYRFYLLQRIQRSYEQASETEQQQILTLFEETGLAAVLRLKTDRPVERINHLEVWGELRPEITR